MIRADNSNTSSMEQDKTENRMHICIINQLQSKQILLLLFIFAYKLFKKNRGGGGGEG
jgi:hypothetical protein